jgi:hypothetical protein
VRYLGCILTGGDQAGVCQGKQHFVNHSSLIWSRYQLFDIDPPAGIGHGSFSA